MKRIIQFIILFFFAYGKSQTMYEVKNNKYRHLSDSLINIRLDSSFTKYIRYSRTWESFFYDCLVPQVILDSLFNSKPIKHVSVYYDFINLCGQKYGYRIRGFGTSGGFQYTFDFNYNLLCEPDYELLREITKAHEKCYISYDEAQKIAIENTKLKSRKTSTNYLMNDLNTKQVYWWIERETGFRNGITEILKIDAISGEIIEKTEMEYYGKKFFEALVDKVFKVR